MQNEMFEFLLKNISLMLESFEITNFENDMNIILVFTGDLVIFEIIIFLIKNLF
jgi:hypothetical protein